MGVAGAVGAGIAYGIMALGTGLSAWSYYQQGVFQKETMGMQAEQQKSEARAAKAQAEFDVERHREYVKRFKSTQKMSLLKAGVQLEGSALDLLADTEVQARLDEDIIRYNAETRAQKLEWGATMSEVGGKQSKRAGTTQAFSTLLSSAGRYNYSRSMFT